MPKPRKTVRGQPANGLRINASKKLRVYELLFQLNQSFEQIVFQFRRLHKGGVKPHISTRFLLRAEELRAEVNFELVELLQEMELRDWTHFGRLRQASEREPGHRKQVRPKRRADVRRKG